MFSFHSDTTMPNRILLASGTELMSYAERLWYAVAMGGKVIVERLIKKVKSEEVGY